MAKKALCIVGGVLMIVSVFLPVLFFSMSASGLGVSVNATIYYWMFGFAYLILTASAGGQTASLTDAYFEPDMLGGICMGIIIVGAILAFVFSSSESKVAIIGGLIGLLSMIVYISGVYMNFMVPNWVAYGAQSGQLMPFVGFYVCIVGGILALVGGALSY